MRHWRFIVIVGIFSLFSLLGSAAHAAQVGLIKINGAIGPAAADYISRAVDVATEQHDECLIIEMDTPGGLLDSASEIVGTFYASKTPIVVYVAPAPAHAGSAGVFITMAADIAAMAPHTRIGAAHPVELGSSGEVEQVDDTMKKKIENDTISLAQSIADKRNRNAQWAKSAVLDSASITAEEALRTNVIDLIATDTSDLLKQIDGRKINGQILHTANASVVEITMNPWEHFSELFLRPEVMFILMLMVIYGIIGELSSPGAILPGVVGATALILVLYMSAVLPVSVTGLVLIGLALLLFTADAYATTHGILTAGGVITFFLGSMMLFSHGGPGYQLSLSWIIPGTVVTALFFMFIVAKAIAAQKRPAYSGREAIAGKTARVIARIDLSGGKVFFEGETWNAVSPTPVEPGQAVEITGIEGLTRKVKPSAG